MMKKAVALACAFLMVVLVLDSGVQAISGLDKNQPESVLAPANAPVWKVGDSWSMGVKVDINDLARTYISEMKNLTKNSSSQIKAFDAQAEGFWGFYETYKIAEVTADSYRMSIEIGQGMHFTGSMSETGQMPKEGTQNIVEYIDMNHSYNYSNVYQTEERTMSVSAGVDYELMTTGNAYFDKNTIAVKSISLSTTAAENMWFKAKGYPDYTGTSMGDYKSETLDNGTLKITYTMTIYYTDYDISISSNGGTDCTVTYSPELDIFHFPISVGEVWPVVSNMTTSGSYWGTVKQTGIPQSMLMTLAASGITFPLDITNSKYNRGRYQNGAIKPETTPVAFTLQCTGTKDILLPDNTVTTCYVIDQYLPSPTPYGYFDGSSLDGTWTDSHNNTYDNYTVPVGYVSEEYPISDYRVTLIDERNYATMAETDPLSNATQHWTSMDGVQGSLAYVDNNGDGILNAGDRFRITNLQQSSAYALDVFYKPADICIMSSTLGMADKAPAILSNVYNPEPSAQAAPWFAPTNSSGSGMKQYYSNDKGFIVAGEVTSPDSYGYYGLTGKQTFMLKPLSEADAKNGMDGVKLTPAAGQAVSSWIMIMAISAVVAIIIVVYLGVFILHRKRKAARADAARPGTQPAPLNQYRYQPAGQQYPQSQYGQHPQQYPQQQYNPPPPQY